MVDNFHMNLLDFEQNKNFANIMFSYSMILIINKPAHVTEKTATAIGKN